MRKWPIILGAVIVLIIVVVYWQGVERQDQVFISEHYNGWVRIEYGVKGAPKLWVHWGGPLFGHQDFPEAGIFQTSTELDPRAGGVLINYSTVMEWRQIPDGMIDGRVLSSNILRPDGSHFDRDFEIFFIGPPKLYALHKNALERFKSNGGQYVVPRFEDLPKVGNIKH